MPTPPRRPNRTALALVAAAAGAALAPAAADATIVGLGAEADRPSACFAPKVRTASTSCQLFAGASLRIFANASDEDGMTRLQPAPFTLFSLARGRPPAPVISWTLFDENDADDDPVITPAGDSDYEARFGGNPDLAPATSATLAVQVGIALAIPTESRSGGARVRLPVTVALGAADQRGRLELRRCRRPKEFSARSCAGRRGYDVVARRTVRRAGRQTFAITMPPRTLRRYEVAFRPTARRFTVTRQAFQLLRGFDGRTTYRYTVRRAPFGNR